MNVKEFNKLKSLMSSEAVPQRTEQAEWKASGTVASSGAVAAKTGLDALRAMANAEAPKEKRHIELHEENMHKEIMRKMAEIFPTYAELLVHNCNEFRGTRKEGAKRKVMGVRKGFPDLTFFLGSEYYHGLHIELKYGKNKQSEEQKRYEKILTNAGYQYVVCKSVEEFITGINQYILLGRWGEKSTQTILKENKNTRKKVNYIDMMEGE